MSTTSVRYNVPSSAQGISVATELDAPSYSQNTMWNFLKSVKAREFEVQLNSLGASAALAAVLSIPTTIGGIFAEGYNMYYQDICNQIITTSDQYPGVIIKVITSVYGTNYSVEGWSDVTTAVVYLTNTDVASEYVTGVYTC